MVMSSHKIDYSKWDKLCVEEEPRSSGPPRVTRFDNPCSVVIGGNADGSVEVRSVPSATASASVHSSVDVPLWSKQGGVLHEYVWRQDRYSVDALIALPASWVEDGVRGTDLNVELVEYGKKLSVKARRNKQSAWNQLGVWELSFPVEEDEDSWMWEVVRAAKKVGESVFGKQGDGAREEGRISAALGEDWLTGCQDSSSWVLVAVFLKKKSVASGLTVWWRSLLKGDHESFAADAERSTADIAGAKSMQQVWEEAHAAFKEKARTRVPVQIPLDCDEDHAQSSTADNSTVHEQPS